MIVEDEARLRDVLVSSAQECGFRAKAVRAAEEAIAQMEQDPCDIVMLDLNLPCMDGLRCFEIVRERWPATSAIILTGFGTLEAAQRAIRLGVVEFLTKPASLGDIERALHRAWRMRFELSEDQVDDIPPITTNEAREAVQHDSPRTMHEIERESITAALDRHGGNREAAAAELGMSTRKLYYRLSEHRSIDARGAGVPAPSYCPDITHNPVNGPTVSD